MKNFYLNETDFFSKLLLLNTVWSTPRLVYGKVFCKSKRAQL